MRCPCGTGETYEACCGRLHDGAGIAATAEALMRSRYSAFAVGDAAYLNETWDRGRRPDSIELDSELRWLSLEIVETVAGGPFDSQGIVEFRAHYRSPAGRGQRHERSRFAKQKGRWVYVEAEPLGGTPMAGA
jgi:SEC-C motif-containing protein